MNDFLKLPLEERWKYFQVAADRIGLPAYLVEKDFWVCWILEKLFTSYQFSEHLTFKGGTSLSKVYGLIKRFSEDIDLSIEKSFFGFKNDKDPEKAPSAKKRTLLLEELGNACKNCVQEIILSELQQAIESEIPEKESWKLSVDKSDPDGQTLLFAYPVSEKRKTEHYVNPVVKMEFGARAEHWPVSNKIIRPYVQEAIADSVAADVNLRVLDIERTFWEKATILHMFAHYPEGKRIPIRQSRHYYDFYCMANSDLCASAKADLDLLLRVAEHKSIYFRAAWARYDLAKPGSLRLVPEEWVLDKMAEDYNRMGVMFFELPPKWTDIVRSLQDFENQFNSIGQS
jgi:hypothetical protein